MNRERDTDDARKTVLRAVDLSVGYKGVAVASHLNLSVGRGEVAALLGRNGIGKSTLLRTLTGELRPVTGEVFIEGRPLASFTRRELARTVAVVSTERVDAGALTVGELVALGRHPYTGFFGALREADRKVVADSMEAVGIAYKKDAFVANLSDGERQKAMIARALAQQTPLLVLDEPFSFLDVASRVAILSLLRNIAHTRKIAVLFSSHDVAQALRMADSVWLFTADRCLVGGKPAEIVADGVISSLFDADNVEFSPAVSDFIERKEKK